MTNSPYHAWRTKAGTYGQGLIRALETIATVIWEALVFLLLLLVLVRPSWRDIRRGYRPYDVGLRRRLDPRQAEFLFQRCHTDAEHTDSKTKQLLTLSGVLAPIALVLTHNAEPRW